MNNLTLKQLRYFDVLIRHGHFGRASQACAVSQPAISMQIKDLEEKLGTCLLERNARQVQLTSFGEEFAKRVKAILRSVDELGELANAMEERWIGRLRIGIIPTVAPYLLPRTLDALITHQSDLDVHVREALTERLVEELDAGRLDLAIVALPISEHFLEEQPLFEENFVLVTQERNALAKAVMPEQLREMKLLLLEEGHCFRDQALSFCNVQSGPPREVMEGTSLSTLVQMVNAGIGVTLLPEMAIDVETRSTGVSVQHFTEPKPSRTIGFVWRKSSPLEKQLQHVAETIRQAVCKVRGTN